MIVVSNTSPITNLAAIAQLSLLQNLYNTIIIPIVQPVLDELIASAGFWVSSAVYKRTLQLADEE